MESAGSASVSTVALPAWSSTRRMDQVIPVAYCSWSTASKDPKLPWFGVVCACGTSRGMGQAASPMANRASCRRMTGKNEVFGNYWDHFISVPCIESQKRDSVSVRIKACSGERRLCGSVGEGQNPQILFRASGRATGAPSRSIPGKRPVGMNTSGSREQRRNTQPSGGKTSKTQNRRDTHNPGGIPQEEGQSDKGGY